MNKITLLLMMAFCLIFVGCGNKDAEVNAFIAENSAVVKDICEQIDADPTSKGLDAAQKSFDGKKAGLKTKWDAIKDARGVEVSAETKKKLNDTIEADKKRLTDVLIKYAMKMVSDPDARSKFQKLMTDYTDTLKP